MSKAPPVKKSPVTKAIDTAVAGLAGQWVHVFSAGTHTDSAGKASDFSEDDLDQMVENVKLGAAPIVLGHPKNNDPAYGWGDQLKRVGKLLFAKFKDVQPGFEAGVKSGAYRNRSLSIFKDKRHGWRVRHYGFLGAVLPAIDGMEPIAAFAAPEAETFEFAAPGYSLVWGLESAAKLMRSLRDRMIEKEGLEAADATLPQWQIDSMTEAANLARQQFNEANPSLFNQPTGEDDMTITQEAHDAAVAKARAEGVTAGKEGTVSQAEFSAAQTELVNLKKAEQKTRIAVQIKSWKDKGVILPADEAGLSEYMATLEAGGAEFSFSKAEGGEEKKTPAQFFADFMATRKPVIKLGGSGSGGEDGALDVTSTAAVTKAANDFMAAEEKEGRTVSSANAVQHVIRTATTAK